MIMTDEGVDALIAGDSRVSSGGGATLGTLGIAGGGAGGASGGVESITFAFSTGAFIGGNVGTTSLSLLPELNQAAYGSEFSQASVLGGRGGKLAEAKKIRALLSNAVKESWAE
jgi:lipid-binding SYLF domain-containing protein